MCSLRSCTSASCGMYIFATERRERERDRQRERKPGMDMGRPVRVSDAEEGGVGEAGGRGRVVLHSVQNDQD